MEHRPFPPNATRPPQSRFPWPVIAILVAGVILAAIVYLAPNPNRAAPSSTNNAAAGSSVLRLTGVSVVPQDAAGAADIDVYAQAMNSGLRPITGAMVAGTFKDSKGATMFEEQRPAERVEGKERNADVVAKSLGEDPIKPGQTVSVRVRFEQVPANWNHEPPQLSVMRVAEAK